MASHSPDVQPHPSNGVGAILTVPGTFQPGLALDRDQRLLWLLRWDEQADLWIATEAAR